MLCSQGCSFHWLQRQATKDAGAISGLNVLRIIIEPTGTVETLSTSTGAFQDRENAFSSVGYFSGKTFINYSNDDKLTDEHHVMTKIRTVEPLTGHFEVGRSWFALPRFRTVCPRRPVFPWPAPDQQGRC